VPTLTSAIDGPSGTMVVSPACATVIPSGVSRHCVPVNKYQASGPECRWTVVFMPGVKTASMYHAVYFLSGFIGSGPMSATRSPPDGCQSAAAIEWSHTLSNASTTVARGALAASTTAAARVR
jgi:hypothetical protein